MEVRLSQRLVKPESWKEMKCLACTSMVIACQEHSKRDSAK